MNQNENQWDKLLKIKTTGRDDSRADQYRYPYEPTPYCVLERLANSGLISKKNVVLDYGTGKGRVCFFLSYQTRCSSIGVEYDDRIYAGARANQEQAVSGKRTSFELTSAEEYPVPTSVDRCYFFNPFSIEILRKVLSRIYESYYENPREILLFFYYPSEEYISCLMTEELLLFFDEIDTEDLLFCVSKDHPLANQSTMLLTMLAEEPLILFNTDSVQVMTLTRQFKAAGVNPHIVLNTSQITTLINMVKADKIGCFLYKSMVDMYPDLVGIPVFPAIEQRIGVIWRKGKYQNAVTEKVIRYLKNY